MSEDEKRRKEIRLSREEVDNGSYISQHITPRLFDIIVIAQGKKEKDIGRKEEGGEWEI